jgi:Myb-like DNA-binding protein FlbD
MSSGCCNSKRRRFTKEEDELIIKLVEEDKLSSWNEVAKHVPGRNGCQCRDRYNGYLYMHQYKALTKSKRFSEEEDRLLIEKYRQFGPRWVKISKFIPGRTGCQLKNRWHKKLKKKTNVSCCYSKQERRSKRAKYGKTSSSETEDNFPPADTTLEKSSTNKADGVFESVPDGESELFLL